MTEQSKSAPTSPKSIFGKLAMVATYVLDDPSAPHSSAELSAIDGALRHAVPPSKHSKLIAQ